MTTRLTDEQFRVRTLTEAHRQDLNREISKLRKENAALQETVRLLEAELAKRPKPNLIMRG